MFNKLLLIGISAFLSCCATSPFHEIPEYRLVKSGPFLVSESPAIWNFFEDKRLLKNGVLKIDAFIKNSEKTSATLKLRESTFSANGKVESADCGSQTGVVDNLELKPDAMVRIMCSLVLRPTSENQLGSKDTILQIRLPSDKGDIQLERLVRIEDFK